MYRDRRTLSSFVAPLLLSTALALTGCTGTEAESDAAPPPTAVDPAADPATSAPNAAGGGARAADDPCVLLSQQQAAQLLKTDVDAGELNPTVAGPKCSYSATAGLETIILMALAGVPTTPDGLRDAMQRTLNASTTTAAPISEVGGVGDAAYATGDGKLIWFSAGGGAYSLTLFYPGSDARKVATDAAKLAAANA